MSTVEPKLTGKQERAIIALLSHRTIQEAASSTEIGESTLIRWLTIPVFRERYDAERRQLFDAAKNALRSAATGAVATLVNVQDDPTAPPTARVSAARSILDLCMRIQETDDILERLDRLESAGKGMQ